MEEVVRWALLSDYATWIVVAVAAASLAANYWMYKRLNVVPAEDQSLMQKLESVNQHLEQLAASKTHDALALQELRQELQSISTRLFGLQNVVHKSLAEQQGAPTGIRGLR